MKKKAFPIVIPFNQWEALIVANWLNAEENSFTNLIGPFECETQIVDRSYHLRSFAFTNAFRELLTQWMCTLKSKDLGNVPSSCQVIPQMHTLEICSVCGQPSTFYFIYLVEGNLLSP